MSEIPGAVLSEHFQERMQGRRLVAAVFTTFQLEPAFFEEEVLPVFLDVALSQSANIRLVQLSEALVSSNAKVAVYYDRHGLVPGGGSAKLDVQRQPMSPTAIFHPKNVFALVEEQKADEDGHRARTLLCACMSSNLTRAGWWENVEVAHVEAIAEGEHTNLRDPLIEYLDALVGLASGRRANNDLRAQHEALLEVRKHLVGCSQREHRSVDGRLRTQFHGGSTSVVDFLTSATGTALRGMCLEVISPYFDKDAASDPLDAMLEAFDPEEVRVLLPKNDAGEALCTGALYEAIAGVPGVSWSELPKDLLKRSKQEGARRRTVHAKVYRFFEPKRGGREILYVGSANLTRPGFAASNAGGNWESGFVVEATSKGRPDWWMGEKAHVPERFAPDAELDEAEGIASTGGTPLMLRYRWDTQECAAFWTERSASPALEVLHGNVVVLAIAPLASREWTVLGSAEAQRLAEHLVSTSLFEVRGHGESGYLLVQEEGMHARPSLLHELTAAEILRYWALLTPEQRSAYIEARVRVGGEETDPLVTALPRLEEKDTLFDRFAGIFHAFSCLEGEVKKALEAGQTRIPDYRLFGQRYDSLGSLVDRVLAKIGTEGADAVEQYVTLLSARQLMTEVARAYPDYWQAHRGEAARIEEQIARGDALRDVLAAGEAEMPAFLAWFDDWFLRRAEPLPEEEG